MIWLVLNLALAAPATLTHSTWRASSARCPLLLDRRADEVLATADPTRSPSTTDEAVLLLCAGWYRADPTDAWTSAHPAHAYPRAVRDALPGLSLIQADEAFLRAFADHIEVGVDVNRADLRASVSSTPPGRWETDALLLLGDEAGRGCGGVPMPPADPRSLPEWSPRK